MVLSEKGDAGNALGHGTEIECSRESFDGSRAITEIL